MSITLNLPKHLEELVEAQARQAGMPVEHFLIRIIQNAVARPLGDGEAPVGEEREHAARQLEAVMQSMTARLRPGASEQDLEQAMHEALEAMNPKRPR
jgi:hypothetical protein